MIPGVSWSHSFGNVGPPGVVSFPGMNKGLCCVSQAAHYPYISKCLQDCTGYLVPTPEVVEQLNCLCPFHVSAILDTPS